VFSPQDFELAARLLGLPVPQTPAECAAAVPMTATVMRSYYKAPAPMPGFEGDGIQTSATRSLNAMPRVGQPEARNQLAHRLQAGLNTRDDDIETRRLLEILLNDPEVREAFMNFIATVQENSRDSGEFYGQQRPVEFDVPGLGGQYSMLNAPGSSMIPPSQQFQALS
jgi:hypothetical protein